jgi:D-alanyl-D-alanine carboxypeptidase (penicillin-binding protein 5/6)
MNARARELGLAHTHYSTPIGLDTAGNYSSASDLVQLTRFLLRTQPLFRRVVSLPTAVLRTGDHVRVVSNRNDLVGRVPWITGVKTGHTLDAGYVLVGSGTSAGISLISVVLGTPSESTRDESTLALLRYGFASYRLVTPVVAGTVLARPSVRYRSGAHADAIAASTFRRLLPRSVPVTIRIRAPREISGGRRAGAAVGSVVVLAGGQAISTIPLVLAHAVPAVSPLTVAAHYLTRPVTLLVLMLLVATIFGLAILRRKRITASRTAPSSPA